MKIWVGSDLTAFFEFKVCVALFDQIHNPWLGQTLVSFESNLEIDGNTSKHSSEGFANFTVYSKEAGNMSIWAKEDSGLTAELQANVSKLKQKISITEKIVRYT